MRSESADVGKCRMKVSLLKVQCAVGKCKLTKSSNTDLTSATCHRKSNASSTAADDEMQLCSPAFKKGSCSSPRPTYYWFPATWSEIG